MLCFIIVCVVTYIIISCLRIGLGKFKCLFNALVSFFIFLIFKFLQILRNYNFVRNVYRFINFKKKWTLLLQHFLLLKRKPGSIFQWGIFFCVFADIENHFYLLKMKYSRKYKISYRKSTVETI